MPPLWDPYTLFLNMTLLLKKFGVNQIEVAISMVITHIHTENYAGAISMEKYNSQASAMFRL